MTKKYLSVLVVLSILVTAGLLLFRYGDVLSATTQFGQVINPGTLIVDIVDESYVSVVSPAVSMSTEDFSFTCHASTGTLGTTTERLYVINPDSADSGWSLTIAPSDPTDLWTGTAGTFDFNDSTSAGCLDGADTDSYGGQLTIDPAVSTLTVGSCSSCNTTGVSKGSSAAFIEGVNDSITLLTADASASDVGDILLTGVSISQTLPGEQSAGNDYSINLMLTVTVL